MESTTPTTPARAAAHNGLAVVGFIALITLALFLAVYAARFIPDIVNGIGSGAVYLGSVFTPGSDSGPSLTVVSTSTPSGPTISFGNGPVATTTTATTTSPAPKPAPVRPTPVHRTPGTGSSETVQIGGSASGTGVLTGLPDLVTTIDGVGYLATSSADSFVSATTVPTGARPAVRFTIKNNGTNQTGLWRFSASIPTQTAYFYQSQSQQSLMPGDSIQYTLGFDQANRGANQMISVTANFDHAVTESNTENNSASANLTILGN